MKAWYKLTLCLIALNSIYPNISKAAGRKLISVPIGVAFIAGDNVCKNNPGKHGVTDPTTCTESVSCVSSDVSGKESLGVGVKAVTNSYYLQMSNVSNITQTVTVTFENTVLGYSVSDPPFGSGINNKDAKSKLIAPQSKTVTIAPNATVGLNYSILCKNGSSACFGKIGDPADPPEPPDKYYPEQGYTCQSMYSTVRATFDIKEDRGAVKALFATFGGRSHGIKDKTMTYINIEINGGRSF